MYDILQNMILLIDGNMVNCNSILRKCKNNLKNETEIKTNS